MADEFDESLATIVDFLLRWDQRQNPGPFLCGPAGAATTFDQALARVARVVLWLDRLGISRGEVIPCYLDEQLPSLYFSLACAVAGIVPMPLSPMFSRDYFFKRLVEPVGARAVFTTAAHAPGLGNHGVRVLSFDDCTRDGAGQATLGNETVIDPRAARALLAARSAALKPRDLFMIQPTAGSTGAPKLVLRRHDAFGRYARFVGDEIRSSTGEPDRVLLAATLTHAFGLHMLTTALRLGATIAVPTALDTAVSLEEVRALDPTVLPLLPRVQRALYSAAQRSPRGRIFGPSARVVCSAGGRADREILRTFAAEGIDIVEFYGSSEASLVAVTPRGGWRPDHAGRVVADVDARIAEDGELLVRSPGVTAGYLGDETATAQVFVDGYYRTGDFAELTADRYMRVLGRKSDVFNTQEGTNIHPRRIEEMIERSRWVYQAILVGDQRPYVCALIVIADRMGVAHDGSAAAVLLEPASHGRLYAGAAAALAEINRSLERVERVSRFLLFSGCFPAGAYRVVGAGKVRRDRASVARLFARELDRLYAAPSVRDGSHVPIEMAREADVPCSTQPPAADWDALPLPPRPTGLETALPRKDGP